MYKAFLRKIKKPMRKKYDHTYIEVSKDTKWMRVLLSARDYWILTTDSYDDKLMGKYKRRYSEGSEIDILNYLAHDYPRGAKAWYCGLTKRIWRNFVEKLEKIETHLTITLCGRIRKALPGHRIIYCLYCNKKMSIPNKYPGLEIECPVCKKVFKAVRRYV